LRLHVFAEESLMLWETAGVSPGDLPNVNYCGYVRVPRSRQLARLYLSLHIIIRPINLRASVLFAAKFNRELTAPTDKLMAAIALIGPGDAVLWMNPSWAVAPLIDRVMQLGVRLSLYFVDPVHRLGVSKQMLAQWSNYATVSTYSTEEAKRYGVRFLVPYAPKRSVHVTQREFDLVYIGSPSPKRLLWLLVLKGRLFLRGARGFMRLASRQATFAKVLPGVFVNRMSFVEYAELCSKSRGVLELHEADAEGVTLRATLCQSLGVVHVCNVQTTPSTLVVSLLNLRVLDEFLRTSNSTLSPPALEAPDLEVWLTKNFAS